MAKKHHEEDIDPIDKELQDLKKSQSKFVSWKDLPKIRFRVLRVS